MFPQFIYGAIYGLGVLHPPCVLADLSGGQYDIRISHKIQQQGELTMAQIYRPATYRYLLPRRVDKNITHLKGCCLCAGGVIVVVVFGISSELGISRLTIME